MPGFKSENNIFDYDKGRAMGAFVLYGLLKGQISREEADRLYKEITVYTVTAGNDSEPVGILYGQKYGKMARDIDLNGEGHDSVKDTRPNVDLGSGDFTTYLEPVWDDAVKRSKNTYREIAALMKEKASKIKFPNPKVRDYYDSVQIMMEDLANNGGWHEKIEEDPLYEYAWNLQVKMNITAANPGVEDDGQFSPGISFRDDYKTLAAYSETDILDALSGAVRANRKYEEALKTGKVSRNELIAEFMQEKEKLEKAVNISKKQFDKLDALDATQNDMDEFTNGTRGYAHILSSLNGKIELLNAGWPLSDISAMSRAKQVMDRLKVKYQTLKAPYDKEKKALDEEYKKVNDMPIETAEQEKARNDRLSELGKKTNELNEKEKQLSGYGDYYEELKKIWEAATKGPITESTRDYCLNHFYINMGAMKIRGLKGITDRDFAERKLSERSGAELAPADKALMTGDFDEMYKCLNDVDPTFMKSSAQFKALKTALKDLANLSRGLKEDDPEQVKEYTDQIKKVGKLATKYLRYKKYEAEGPGREGHKRSDTEKQRVQTVDNILHNLKQFTVPGTDKFIIDFKDPNYSVVPNPVGDRLLGEYTVPETNDKYEQFMRLHTGGGVMNGTKKEMQDDLCKVIGAYLYKKHKPATAFDEKKINDLAKQAKEELMIKDMTEAELRGALINTETIGKTIDNQNRKIYGLEKPVDYKNYIRDMKLIYKNMVEPEPGNKAYEKMFESLKKVAHLPDTLDGSSFDKVNKIIANANHDIMVAGQNHFKKAGIGGADIENVDNYILKAMNVVADNCKHTYKYIDKIRIDVNTRRGVYGYKDGDKIAFDITNGKYFSPDTYNADTIPGTVKNRQGGKFRRELDEELLKTNAKNVRQSVEDTRKEMAGDNQAAQKKTTRTRSNSVVKR
ncbi:hypothetical protein SAMN04487934_10227 [Eubacterium ruminantium]|nr:hypothetical protein SAMN04487934_10227 [Eubacterium ruminantium]